jgi:LacI family transcriptional regulator
VSKTSNVATLSEVAAHAGVSLATASRVLNGSVRVVNEAMRARVLASAAALGYSANVQAQAMARGLSSSVAMVVGDIADPYFSAIASGAIDVADAHGLTMTLTATSTRSSEATALASLRGLRTRAVIMARSRSVDSRALTEALRELATIETSGARVVLIGLDDPDYRSVSVQNREGAANLASALVGRGYRDFAVLAGDGTLVTPSERSAGFIESARRHGVSIPASRVLGSAFNRDGALTATAALLASGERPDCIFAATDVMALGAMTAIREAGLLPGMDIGVAGYDDIPLVQDVNPSLSTVRLPLAAIGQEAMRLALSDADDVVSRPFEGTVMLRDSTPPRRP